MAHSRVNRRAKMKPSKSNGSAVGLDVGTSRVVTAHRAADVFMYESQLNAFVNIPFSKMTAGVLERESLPHTVHNGEIIVYGKERKLR